MKLKEILVVDDDEVANFIHSDILNETGLANNVTVLTSGADALKYLQNHSPDIILLDVNMPKMDGFNFLEEYEKLNKRNNATRIVMMLSTALRGNDIERAKKLNGIVSCYVEKPLNKDILNTLLKVGS